MKAAKHTMVILPMIVALSSHVWAQRVVWHSPLTMTTFEGRLVVEQDCCPTTTMKITSTDVDDNLWVEVPLVVPSNEEIHAITVCYSLSNPAAFITQVRLTQTAEPDAAVVRHDDGADLLDPGPVCYTSPMSSGPFLPEGAVTLGLRLDFTNTAEQIKIGGIGIETMPLPTASEGVHLSTSPESYRLGQNYPNPFNPSTTIEYELQSAGGVELNIYDAMGNLVRTLVNREMGAGNHRVQWDGRDNRGRLLASGSYFYQLRAGNTVGTKKMVFLK